MPSERKKCCICKSGVSSRFYATTIFKDELQSCFLLQEGREGFLCNSCMSCVQSFRQDNSLTFEHRVDSKLNSAKRQIGGKRTCRKGQEEGAGHAVGEIDAPCTSTACSEKIANMKEQIGRLEAENNRLKTFEERVVQEFGVNRSTGVQQLKSAALQYIIKNSKSQDPDILKIEGTAGRAKCFVRVPVAKVGSSSCSNRTLRKRSQIIEKV